MARDLLPPEPGGGGFGQAECAYAPSVVGDTRPTRVAPSSRRKWTQPLLDGELHSAFLATERLAWLSDAAAVRAEAPGWPWYPCRVSRWWRAAADGGVPVRRVGR